MVDDGPSLYLFLNLYPHTSDRPYIYRVYTTHTIQIYIANKLCYNLPIILPAYIDVRCTYVNINSNTYCSVHNIEAYSIPFQPISGLISISIYGSEHIRWGHHLLKAIQNY